MTSSPVAPRTAPPARGVLLPLLAVMWVLVPPWLAFIGIVTAAPFFGEQPTPTEQARSTLLLVAAGASAVLLPLAGALIARGLGWRTTAAAFWIATAVGVLAVVGLPRTMATPGA